MKAVADASVVIALSMIDRLPLLRHRFPEGVLLPRAVWHEVVEMGSGHAGSKEISSASWISVCDVEDKRFVGLLLSELDEGEAEAIVLATEKPPAVVLLDEKEARAYENNWIVCG